MTVLKWEIAMDSRISESLTQLASRLKGDLHTGRLMRTLYATDASAYQEMPLAVAIPHSEEDLIELIRFASTQGIGLIPRTAGTSLAGQVVGNVAANEPGGSRECNLHLYPLRFLRFTHLL